MTLVAQPAHERAPHGVMPAETVPVQRIAAPIALLGKRACIFPDGGYTIIVVPAEARDEPG